MGLKERLVPLEIGDAFDARFEGAFLLLYFSESDDFVFTQVTNVGDVMLLTEHIQVRRLLPIENIKGAFDLCLTYGEKGKDGLDFLARHGRMDQGTLEKIKDAIRNGGPLFMLEFESQKKVETFLSRDNRWVKLREFRA